MTTYVMEDGGGLKNLEAIVKEKDLEVHVMIDLKSEEQCTQSARKVQAVLGMVKRHFKELTLSIYKSYIWPHLEYCVQAWSPHLFKDKDYLEQIQRRVLEIDIQRQIETAGNMFAGEMETPRRVRHD